MNRNIYAIAIFFLSLIFVSCVSDENEIDEEWKKMNEDAYTAAVKSGNYNELPSLSKNGNVLWKESNELIEDDLTTSLRITSAGTPEYTDSVTVRYIGWFYQKDGRKIIFDTTEDNVNKTPISFAVKGVVDGWSTALQYMKEGEERELVIPWTLAYGSAGKGTAIAGYTTLYFNVKLLKIIQMTGKTS